MYVSNSNYYTSTSSNSCSNNNKKYYNNYNNNNNINKEITIRNRNNKTRVIVTVNFNKWDIINNGINSN